MPHLMHPSLTPRTRFADLAMPLRNSLRLIQGSLKQSSQIRIAKSADLLGSSRSLLQMRLALMSERHTFRSEVKPEHMKKSIFAIIDRLAKISSNVRSVERGRVSFRHSGIA